MSFIDDFLKKNADTIGNTILEKIGGVTGAPALPPLKFSEPYQNQNNYVEARPAPTAFQPETTVANTPNWMLYGGIALGVVLVVGLLVKR